MEIVIDHRETKLKQCLEDLNPTLVNLSYGDVIFKYKAEEILVIERKTLKDLEASITDGRYRNQKKKLCESCPHHKIYYIIEDWTGYAHTSPMIAGAVLNTMLRDNIKVFTTKSLEDTCSLLREIHARVLKNPGIYMEDVPATMKEDVIKVKNLTPYLAMLCQIPGVNVKTAEVIAAEYSTFSELYKALQEHGAKAFKDLMLSKRKISATVIANVIEHTISPPLQSTQSTDL
jgi:ERCC4-type nuclease